MKCTVKCRKEERKNRNRGIEIIETDSDHLCQSNFRVYVSDTLGK